MIYLVRVIFCAVLPSIGLAAPAEDHWSREMKPADAAALAQSSHLIEKNQYCEALPILETLKTTLPANADVFSMLGYVHRKMGDLALSDANYKHALYLKPGHLGALSYQGELFLAQDNPDAALENLRLLESLCATDCKEKDELVQAIGAWQATKQ